MLSVRNELYIQTYREVKNEEGEMQTNQQAYTHERKAAGVILQQSGLQNNDISGDKENLLQ